ncbi:MAG: tetratricopeptide repeat protein [Cyanobacteriota bacterium]|jgi:tetratricopeptide (TPR) repeat protein
MAAQGTAPGAEPAHSFYLSSPRLGLQQERALAQRLISERQQACRHSYEGSTEPPVATCQADVRGSDHYLLILAGRYGTPQPEYDGKSVTELEFEAAVASERTLHAFFLNYISDMANGLDDDVGRARLEAFKNRVQRHCTAKVCMNAEEFATAITLLAAAPPPRPGATTADPTLPTNQTPHNLPFRARSGDGLIGRQQALSQVQTLLQEGGGPVWITGMDGVGKTALALHHLRRSLERFRSGIVVLDGQQAIAGLVEQLALFARAHFALEVPQALPLAGQLGWLYSRWPGQHAAALLLDELRNPQDLEALGQGLPERFAILVTSRRQLGEARQRVPLAPLGEEEALQLLEQRAERGPFAGEERRQALALAAQVGGLPLALNLLGRQLARDGDLELAELERRLRRRGALAPELQGPKGPAVDLQVERGLQASFQLAWEQLTAAEQELGLLLGELPAAAVPWEPLALCCPVAIQPEAWEEARLGLQQQHLLERRLPLLHQLHPLLHDLFAEAARCREGQERAERQERLAAALARWLAGVSDVLQARSRERSQRSLPLLEALAQWPPERWSGAAVCLPLLALGRLRSALGAYGQAVEALEAGLKRAQAMAEPEAQPMVAGFLVALAGIARERGQLQAAEQQCRQALTLLELGGAGLELERAEALNGLGLTLHELGQPEAETVLRQALELRGQRLGESDPLVQLSRNNLARTLAALGRRPEAEALYRQSLTALEEEPCEVSMAVHNNLASLAMAEGQLEEALAELQEAVRQAELALGERHPRRGELLKNLGVVAELLGHQDAAEQHYRQALELVSEAWGPEDPRSQECRLTLEAFLAEKGG